MGSVAGPRERGRRREAATEGETVPECWQCLIWFKAHPVLTLHQSQRPFRFDVVSAPNSEVCSFAPPGLS